jgi:hypothetical protein
MLNSDRGCFDSGVGICHSLLSSENVLWTFETAGVDCAETNLAGVFSESLEHNRRALEIKAKSRPRRPSMAPLQALIQTTFVVIASLMAISHKKIR